MFEMTVKFFLQGGPFMFLISLIFAIGIAIAFERWMTLNAAMKANKEAQKQFFPLLKKGDMKALKDWVGKSKAPVTNVIAGAIQARLKSTATADIESGVIEKMMEVIPRFERRTSYLATLANIATLMGLLGTIMGLIFAFKAVAHADPAQKATLLSESISVAMNTTAFGLMTAIPLLLSHAYLQNKTKSLIEGFEMVGMKCLNSFSSKSQ